MSPKLAPSSLRLSTRPATSLRRSSSFTSNIGWKPAAIAIRDLVDEFESWRENEPMNELPSRGSTGSMAAISTLVEIEVDVGSLEKLGGEQPEVDDTEEDDEEDREDNPESEKGETEATNSEVLTGE